MDGPALTCEPSLLDQPCCQCVFESHERLPHPRGWSRQTHAGRIPGGILRYFRTAARSASTAGQHGRPPSLSRHCWWLSGGPGR
jgi:hypothetical protein